MLIERKNFNCLTLVQTNPVAHERRDFLKICIYPYTNFYKTRIEGSNSIKRFYRFMIYGLRCKSWCRGFVLEKSQV